MTRCKTVNILSATLMLLGTLSSTPVARAHAPPPLRTEFVEAPRDGKYEWLNRTLIITDVERTPDSAIVRFYKVH
jgi:hypothetical protein